MQLTACSIERVLGQTRTAGMASLGIGAGGEQFEAILVVLRGSLAEADHKPAPFGQAVYDRGSDAQFDNITIVKDIVPAHHLPVTGGTPPDAGRFELFKEIQVDHSCKLGYGTLFF